MLRHKQVLYIVGARNTLDGDTCNEDDSSFAYAGLYWFFNLTNMQNLSEIHKFNMTNKRHKQVFLSSFYNLFCCKWLENFEIRDHSII